MSVRVTGLSSDELSALGAAKWPVERWQELVAVAVEDAAGAFVAGTYRVTADAIEFAPAYPFDPGRTYVVRIDPARLPSPRPDSVATLALRLPEEDPGAPTIVTGIDPDADLWPANLLRFYVHFSGAMPRAPAAHLIQLLDDGGNPVGDALLQSPVDFWSPDQRRYTVFFDPGRVKRGLVPHQTLGRALQSGRRYTLVIDRAWKDVFGRPLASEFRKSFLVGPPVERPLRLQDWTVATPRTGTREPLRVTVPWPLDRALFERSLGVVSHGEGIEGASSVHAGETEWRFTPAGEWQRVPYEVVVLGILEDVSGNMIDQAFEVEPEQASGAVRPERYAIPFTPR
jgi:hypothetical protein